MAGAYVIITKTDLSL